MDHRCGFVLVLFLGQVIVRMRPLSKEEEGEGEQIVQKISSNSVSIVDHTFTFDSVADTRSTQVVLLPQGFLGFYMDKLKKEIHTRAYAFSV